jgi:hypothetical protein
MSYFGVAPRVDTEGLIFWANSASALILSEAVTQ